MEFIFVWALLVLALAYAALSFGLILETLIERVKKAHAPLKKAKTVKPKAPGNMSPMGF